MNKYLPLYKEDDSCEGTHLPPRPNLSLLPNDYIYPSSPLCLFRSVLLPFDQVWDLQELTVSQCGKGRGSPESVYCLLFTPRFLTPVYFETSNLDSFILDENILSNCPHFFLNQNLLSLIQEVIFRQD